MSHTQDYLNELKKRKGSLGVMINEACEKLIEAQIKDIKELDDKAMEYGEDVTLFYDKDWNKFKEILRGGA